MDENKNLEGVELTDEELDELAGGQLLSNVQGMNSFIILLNERGLSRPQMETAVRSLAARQGLQLSEEFINSALNQEALKK